MDAMQCSTILNISKTAARTQEKVDFLLQQKNDDFIFDHHLGINFLILSSLVNHVPDFIDGTSLAKILLTLTSVESKEGGPYFSSLETKDQNIDLDTNVLIGYFLSLQNVELDSISLLVEKAINEKSFDSKIFGSELFTIYFISKFFRGDKKQELINYLLTIKTKSIQDEALVLSSLNNFEFDESFLQKRFGDLETKVNNQEMNELDFTLYLELKKNLTKTNQPHNEEEEKMMDLILKTAEKRFENLRGEMKDFAMQAIKRTIKGNYDHQMPLMPFYMKQALKEKGKNISDDLIAQMGLANIFYWTAFIIYDDFWDEDEDANPQILPTANFFARHYSTFFASVLPESTGFNAFFQELMDKLDAANTWETVYCRTTVENNIFHIPENIPDYGNYERKYEPASGQILGPVAIFVSLGYGLDSPEIKNLITYFKNYLIAMQMNDDAHDWEEDMERGHLSTVVVLLIRDWLEEYPGVFEIDLKKDKEKLKHVYWFKTIRTICQRAVDYTEKSRQALRSIDVLEDPAPLERFITIPENVAKKGLKEQKASVDFLATFKS